jgi:23S rRNA pseudouridine1911/1915/1917 synthase
MARVIEMTVSTASCGQRLDGVIGADPRVGSRSRAGRLIDEGRVLVDGRRERKSHLLSGGEKIALTLVADGGEADATDPAQPFDVVYEDEHLIVIDKPAGLVVHPAPGNPTGTLSQALVGRAGGGDPGRPGIVHRLDKDTSGLIVVAKDDQTLRALQAALQRREVTREYLALVRGHPRSRLGTIDAPLGRDRRSPEQVTVRAGSSRAAVTHFEVVEQLPVHALLRVKLETGRTHQIRAHLAAIELPVSGDPTYGVPGDLGLERQFLHAAKLAFTHPATGEQMSLESPLPDDLAEALKAAHAAGG